MRLGIVIVILVAAGLAGTTALLLGRTPKPPAEKPATQVLVAARDLPAGTLVNTGHWRWQAWPDGQVDKNYILQAKVGEKVDGKPDPVQSLLAGAAVKRAINAGDPITLAKVVKPGDAGFLAGALSPGMRAVGIKISPERSASGFALPGDRVDVILTQQRMRGANAAELTTHSRTILCDVRVLTIDQVVDDVKKEPKVGKTATLELTPKGAEILVSAAANGILSLALRSLSQGEDDKGSCTVGVDPDETAPDAQAPRTASDGPARSLRVYRAEQSQDIKFSGESR
jgi:pilus assembly protein CpaB